MSEPYRLVLVVGLLVGFTSQVEVFADPVQDANKKRFQDEYLVSAQKLISENSKLHVVCSYEKKHRFGFPNEVADQGTIEVWKNGSSLLSILDRRHVERDHVDAEVENDRNVFCDNTTTSFALIRRNKKDQYLITRFRRTDKRSQRAPVFTRLCGFGFDLEIMPLTDWLARPSFAILNRTNIIDDAGQAVCVLTFADKNDLEGPVEDSQGDVTGSSENTSRRAAPLITGTIELYLNRGWIIKRYKTNRSDEKGGSVTYECSFNYQLEEGRDSFPRDATYITSVQNPKQNFQHTVKYNFTKFERNPRFEVDTFKMSRFGLPDRDWQPAKARDSKNYGVLVYGFGLVALGFCFLVLRRILKPFISPA